MITDKMFDVILENTQIKETLIDEICWYGFCKINKNNEFLIFGHPIKSPDGVWYYGNYMDKYRIFFDIDRSEFKRSLCNYARKRHNLAVLRVI